MSLFFSSSLSLIVSLLLPSSVLSGTCQYGHALFPHFSALFPFAADVCQSDGIVEGISVLIKCEDGNISPTLYLFEDSTCGNNDISLATDSGETFGSCSLSNDCDIYSVSYDTYSDEDCSGDIELTQTVFVSSGGFNKCIPFGDSTSIFNAFNQNTFEWTVTQYDSDDCTTGTLDDYVFSFDHNECTDADVFATITRVEQGTLQPTPEPTLEPLSV